MIELKGITWNHTRGYAPVVATAEAYSALHSDVSISWTARSLQQFADQPIEELAKSFDLLIIDHPFVGFATNDGCLLPLDEYISAEFLADQQQNSVGKSHPSYNFGGHQWALAVDAASQVSAYRADLLEKLGEVVPKTWDEALKLARRLKTKGDCRVVVPLIPVDIFCSFQSLCASIGEPPFAGSDKAVSKSAGRWALETLQEFLSCGHPAALTLNPPRLLERMSTTAEIAYCPLLFGYSNYSRHGFRPMLVNFTNIPAGSKNGSAGAILGGTGLAISSHTSHEQAAVEYAEFVASGAIQSSTYYLCGGQPGYRAAWTDPQINASCTNFFLNTLETLDKAYLRPRYNGFMELQDKASLLLYNFLSEGGNPDAVLNTLDTLYRNSQLKGE